MIKRGASPRLPGILLKKGLPGAKAGVSGRRADMKYGGKENGVIGN